MSSATDDRIFYHFWQCPYCQRARVTLAEKGIDYQSVAIDPDDDMPEELVELNPDATVPTFRDDDVSLYGSEVIAEYLEERYPEPPLMPASPVERARARQLIYICDGGLGSALWQFSQATDGEERDEEQAAEAAQEIGERLERLSEHLGERDYFCGDAFSMAEVGLASFVLQLRDLDYPSSKIPDNLVGWMERVAQRPSVRQEILEHPGRD